VEWCAAECERGVRAVTVRHRKDAAPQVRGLAGYPRPVICKLPNARYPAHRHLRGIGGSAGDVKKRLDPVVPGSEVLIPEWPRVSLAGAPCVEEVIGREAGNSAGPVIRQTAGGDLFPELG